MLFLSYRWVCATLKLSTYFHGMNSPSCYSYKIISLRCQLHWLGYLTFWNIAGLQLLIRMRVHLALFTTWYFVLKSSRQPSKCNWVHKRCLMKAQDCWTFYFSQTSQVHYNPAHTYNNMDAKESLLEQIKIIPYGVLSPETTDLLIQSVKQHCLLLKTEYLLGCLHWFFLC